MSKEIYDNFAEADIVQLARYVLQPSTNQLPTRNSYTHARTVVLGLAELTVLVKYMQDDSLYNRTVLTTPKSAFADATNTC